MIILAIDPGPKESAYVIYQTEREVDGGGVILHHGYKPNLDVLATLLYDFNQEAGRQDVVIEWIEGYGLRVGQSVFDTCRWVGRFEQAAGGAHLIGRKAISLQVCNSVQAGDKFIRQALIAKFGDPGTKKSPGPTYGISGDEWSALACAVTFAETQVKQ